MGRKCIILLCLILVALVGCEDNPPEKEKTSLQISKVELLFAPKGDGAPIVVEAIEKEGGLEPTEAINLNAGIAYDLFVSLENAAEQDLNLEENGNDYQFYYGFSQTIFSSPSGAGNIDDPPGLVNYLDEDVNGLPLGLITAWITAESGSFGLFKVVLKHQPDGLKSVSSDVELGATELDVSWELYVN